MTRRAWPPRACSTTSLLQYCLARCAVATEGWGALLCSPALGVVAGPPYPCLAIEQLGTAEVTGGGTRAGRGKRRAESGAAGAEKRRGEAAMAAAAGCRLRGGFDAPCREATDDGRRRSEACKCVTASRKL